MKRHPKVHPHDVLDDLYHAPMHSARRPPTQNRMARSRMRRKRARAEPPQMHADVGAGSLRVRVRGRARAGAAAGTDRTRGGTMLEEDDEILRGIERKVLDAHAEVVHDQPRLARRAARQPRRHQPSRRAVLLQRFREQAPDQLVRVAVARQRYGRAAPGAQGSPGCATL